MKKRNQIKFILAAFIFVLLWQGLEADLLAQQNVGIGTLNPDTSAILDVVATDKGMLIPRVALTGTGDVATIPSPAISLLVYNTATVSDVIPGYYSWNGSAWVPFLTNSALGNGGWSLTGNAGTTAGANFIGTTDAIDWVIKTNNSEAIRVDQNGNVGIGTISPDQLLELDGGGLQINDFDGIGFRGETPATGNVTQDGARIYYDGSFFGGPNDALVIEKTDNSQNDPDGGIAFTNKGMDNIIDTAMVIRGDGNVGIGTISPQAQLEVVAAASPKIRISEGGSTTSYMDLSDISINQCTIKKIAVSGNSLIDINPMPSDGISNASVRLFRITNSTANHNFDILRGNGAVTVDHRLQSGANGTSFLAALGGNVGIGTISPDQLLELDGGGLQINDFDGIGFRGETPATGNVMIDGARIYYDGSFFGSSNDALVIEKTDNSQNDPDGGIAFTNKGMDNIIDTAMVIRGDGKVGIGTNNPDARLTVSSNVRFGATTIGNLTGAVNERFNLRYDAGVATYRINGATVGVNTSFGVGGVNDVMYLEALTQRVGIGTINPAQKLHVAGNGLFSGTVTASCGVLTCSDKRYKKHISPLESSLDKVLQLEGVSYFFKSHRFKDKNFNSRKQIGVIAQDVEQVYPELVSVDQDGFKSVNYAKITPILIEAIKEQQQMIMELREKNNLLRSDNTVIKGENAAINNRLSTIESILNETSKK